MSDSNNDAVLFLTHARKVPSTIGFSFIGTAHYFVTFNDVKDEDVEDITSELQCFIEHGARWSVDYTGLPVMELGSISHNELKLAFPDAAVCYRNSRR